MRAEKVASSASCASNSLTLLVRSGLSRHKHSLTWYHTTSLQASRTTYLDSHSDGALATLLWCSRGSFAAGTILSLLQNMQKPRVVTGCEVSLNHVGEEMAAQTGKTKQELEDLLQSQEMTDFAPQVNESISLSLSL